MLNCTKVILKSLFLTLLGCMNLKNKLTAKQHHFNTNLTKYNVQWGSLLVTYGAFTKFRNLTTINCKIKNNILVGVIYLQFFHMLHLSMELN